MVDPFRVDYHDQPSKCETPNPTGLGAGDPRTIYTGIQQIVRLQSCRPLCPANENNSDPLDIIWLMG